MSDKVHVAIVQQRMKVYQKLEEYRRDVYRLMKSAADSGADLVVFPALSPIMMVDPLLPPEEAATGQQQDTERIQIASMLDRMFRRSTPKEGEHSLHLRRRLSRLLGERPAALYEEYVELFSAIALKFRKLIIAGSLYMRTDETSGVKHVSYAFGPNGQIIGRQEKVHLTTNEMRFCQAGESFEPVKTDFGTLGILVGEDVLYPEAGRILAYGGVDAIVSLAACAGRSRLTRIWRGFVARVDENEVLGVQSHLVGQNSFTPDGMAFIGKTSMRAPAAMLPHNNGLVVEAASDDGEEVVVGVWDFERLREYWCTDEPRLRQGMRVVSYRPLSIIYDTMRTIDQAYNLLQEEQKAAPEGPETGQAESQPPGTERSECAEGKRGVDFEEASKKLGFDLLSSPFSEKKSFKRREEKLKEKGEKEEKEEGRGDT